MNALKRICLSRPIHITPMKKFMNRHFVILALTISAAFPAYAYEADVHYGLTRWLALKAGYLDWQARAIALGNFRVDSGLMGTLSLLPEYACVAQNIEIARTIQERHYPSATPVPADPEKRAVEPGSLAARKALARTISAGKGNEAQYMGLLGAALHPLQDSWAHAGVPTVPGFGSAVDCGRALASAPPVRGSNGPHAADLTYISPASAVAMAKATYEALTEFPPVQGANRVPQVWSSLEPAVHVFAEARSKTAKREWFLSQGFTETDFLEGVTIPDGPKPGSMQFDGRQLPSLATAVSTQHDAPQDVRDFFDRLMVRWLGKESLDAVAADLTRSDSSSVRRAASSSRVAQLAARLKLWKMRDHGTAARLVHLGRDLSATEIAQVKVLTKQSSVYVEAGPQQALFPLVALGPNPSPLLPYILRMLPAKGGAGSRAIAIARLKHAPHDTVGFVAEKTLGGWKLVDVVSVVDQ